MQQILNSYNSYCVKLKAKNLYRTLYTNNFSHSLDFASNDYLHLSQNSDVINSAINAAQKYGTGAQASRLLSGNLLIHTEFEELIAKTKKKDRALIFNSGYQANATVIPALLDKKILGTEPLVFCDHLNHASIHHGCFLSKVKQIRYRHLDMNHLEQLLKEYSDSTVPKFIITESVFGMDADFVDIEHLTILAEKYNAFIYLDEAHAIGVMGENGYGISEGYEDKISLIMGNFSKAIGAGGGFVAGGNEICEYLINYCKGFIYSTAISPMIVGAAKCAWEMLPLLNNERNKIFKMADYLRENAKLLGYNVKGDNSNIIPIIVGEKLDYFREKFRENGINAAFIKSPTVPKGTERIRIAINPNHSYPAIDELLDVLNNLA